MLRQLLIQVPCVAILCVFMLACDKPKTPPESSVVLPHSASTGQPAETNSPSLDDGRTPITSQNNVVDEQGCQNILSGRGEPSELTQSMINVFCAPPATTIAAMNELNKQVIKNIIDEQDPIASHDRYVEARANVQKLKDSRIFNGLRQDRTTSLNVQFNERVSEIRNQLFRDHLSAGIVMAGIALVAGGLAGKAGYLRRLIGQTPELMPSAEVVVDAIGDTFVGSASKVPNAILNAGKTGALGAAKTAAMASSQAVTKFAEAFAFVLKRPDFITKRLIRGGLNEADATFFKFDLFTGAIPKASEFTELNLPGLSYAKVTLSEAEKTQTQFLIRYSRALDAETPDLVVVSRSISEKDLANYESRLAQLAEKNRNNPVVVEINPVTNQIQVLDTPAAALLSVTEQGAAVAVSESVVEAESTGALNSALKKFDYMAGGFVTLGVGTAEVVAFKMGEPFGRREARVPADLYLDSAVPGVAGSSVP